MRSSRSAPDRLGGPLRAFGQHGAEAFLAHDLIEHRQHRVGVAKLQLDAARVVAVEHLVLEKFHRKGDRRAAGDGVHAPLGADLIRQRNRVEIADAAVRAHRRQRFVFRAAVERRNLPALIFRLDDALAAHRAGKAGVVLFQDRVGHLLAADVVGLLEIAAAVVEGGQRADRVLKARRRWPCRNPADLSHRRCPGNPSCPIG